MGTFKFSLLTDTLMVISLPRASLLTPSDGYASQRMILKVREIFERERFQREREREQEKTIPRVRDILEPIFFHFFLYLFLSFL